MSDFSSFFIEITYFISAVLLIWGLKQMSSPLTASRGIFWGGVGMAVATLATFALPGMQHFFAILLALVLGSLSAYWSGRWVKMTDMPQMIALFNGMGGGAAACIAAVECLRIFFHHAHALPFGALTLGLAGALIGSVSFTGSLVAFAKLQSWVQRPFRFQHQHWVNLAVLAASLGSGVIWFSSPDSSLALIFFFIFAALFGVMMTLPIGGADMPVVISLFNALTGLAVAFEGYTLGNSAMIIAGTVVGASGTLLTQLMAKAMNRGLSHVLFSGFEPAATMGAMEGTLKEASPDDAAALLAYANRVLIVPGYGMAVAQAQHKVWELSKMLIEHGVEVRFAIHPVAGRMPGHMNVLLAEAGVPYDLIADLEEVNADFTNTDVTIVIGANDVVNPVARRDKSSPIYGMPILNADESRQILVIKRGQGAGFSGVENALFYDEKTKMVYGDAQGVMSKMIQSLKPYVMA